MSLVDEIMSMEDMLSPGVSACLGCNAELTLRTALKVFGPNTILAVPPGCMGGIGTVGMGQTKGTKTPVFFPLLDNTASNLAGIKKYYNRKGRDVNVVGFAGDGATADAGFQALSGAAERGDNIIYICYDNEGYMNTGFQRSGTTTVGSWTSTTPVGPATKGKPQQKKDLSLIMAMHDIPYMATASPAYMLDMVKKFKRAKEIKDGLSFIHVLNPCSNGWGYPKEKSIDVCRLSIQTRFFPLYEVDHGKFNLSQDVPNPKPIKEFIQMSKKYQHLTDADIENLQKYVDGKWATILRLCNQE